MMINSKSKLRPELQNMTFFALFSDFELKYLQDKPLNKVILDGSDRPNRIVQMNTLYVLYSIIAI